MGSYGIGTINLSQVVVDQNLNMPSAYEVVGRKLAASDVVLDSEDTIVAITTGYGAYVAYHQVNVPSRIKGRHKVRVSVALSPDYTTTTAYVKWLVNGVVTQGGEQSYLYVGASTYATKTEDIWVQGGDEVVWWMKCVNNYFHYKEVRIKGAESTRDRTEWNLT